MNFRSRLEVPMKSLPPPEVQRVAIVGGGIAGLLTAAKLRVPELTLFERNSKAGARKHCTGIVSVETAKRCMTKPELILNSYDTILFTIPRLSLNVVIKSDRAFAVKIDREAHEEHLAALVENRGYRIQFRCNVDGVRFVESRGGSNVMLYATTAEGTRLEYKADVVIIAEGYPSRLAKGLGLKSFCTSLLGLQRIVVTTRRLSRECTSTLYIVFDEMFGEEGFGWIVPLDERKLIVGIATRCLGKDVRTLLNEFLYFVAKKFDTVLVSEGSDFGGVILRGYPKKIVDGRVLGIGDAIASVKSVSGGGLYAISWLAELYSAILGNGMKLRLIKYVENLRRELQIQYRIAKVLYHSLGLLMRIRTPVNMCIEVFIKNLDYDRHEHLMLSVFTARVNMMRTIGAEEVMRRRSTELRSSKP